VFTFDIYKLSRPGNIAPGWIGEISVDRNARESQEIIFGKDAKKG